MNSIIYFVGDEPYCLWGVDLEEKNKQYLDSIDGEYFEFIVKAHASTEDAQRSSVALRLAYHHAVETLFVLLCAVVQAPKCAYAFISKCSNEELRRIVKRIDIEDSSLIARLNITKISWISIAEMIFKYYKPGTVQQESMIKLYALLWRRLVGELLDQKQIDEYNSLKHGFRIQAGGFTLAIGGQSNISAPANPAAMQVITASEYGSSYFKIEPIGNRKGNRSVKARIVSSNWSIEKIGLLLQLISMSIINVRSALKCFNGYDPMQNMYFRPLEDEDFNKPWTATPSEASSGFEFILQEDKIPFLNKQSLLAKIDVK